MQLGDDFWDVFIAKLVNIDLIHLHLLAAQYQLESVLYLGLGAAVDEGRDLAPLVTVLQPLFEEVEVLRESPRVLVNLRVERRQPSFAALFTITHGKCGELDWLDFLWRALALILLFITALEHYLVELL